MGKASKRAHRHACRPLYNNLCVRVRECEGSQCCIDLALSLNPKTFSVGIRTGNDSMVMPNTRVYL